MSKPSSSGCFRQPCTVAIPAVNARRVYRVMRKHNLLLLYDKPLWPHREHNDKIAVAESNQRWCSDGFESGCDDGEKLRLTFTLNCCNREAIDRATNTGGYDSTTVQDVMPGAVEKRFVGAPEQGCAVRIMVQSIPRMTRGFATDLNPEACTTAVSSPQSNGMVGRFVNTMKEDCIAFMPKPNVRTSLQSPVVAFSHYNENHPHSAPGYHSPGEYRYRRASLT
ncbi:transposase [Salmonella enterica]|nr:transposase [Salmonella enterica]